jgi:hypothetical protein
MIFMRTKIYLLVLLPLFMIMLSGCDNNGKEDDPEETWETPIIIGFAAGSVTITGGAEGNIIYKTGSPNSIILTVSGFENIGWYVNTMQTPTTGNSITLNASDFDLGVHTVSFTGFRDGRLLSDSVIFSVYP